MLLREIVNYLDLGEIKQTGLTDFVLNTTPVRKYREVLQHIQLALLQLYTRFPVLEKELVLRTYANKTNYILDKQFALSSGNEEWWIEDSIEQPFTNDILRISSAWGSSGREIPINDEHSLFSLYLPSPSVLQIPRATGAETLHLLYRAKPKPIAIPLEHEEADLDQDILLPEFLLEPLLNYVEYRARKSQGGESAAQLAQLAKSQFEELCMRLEASNVMNNGDIATCIKPQINGWV